MITNPLQMVRRNRILVGLGEPVRREAFAAKENVHLLLFESRRFRKWFFPTHE